jgi:hypothetical protein
MDLAILETYDGGDIQIKGNDLAIVHGIENQLYLAMFGGNIEQLPSVKNPEQSFNYWANDLLFIADTSQQFNSFTEISFDKIPLTSSGRVQLENAIKRDLEYLKKLNVIFTVSVTIVSTDRIDIIIKITQGINTSVVIINYKKKLDGDFFIFDFNNDFNV